MYIFVLNKGVCSGYDHSVHIVYIYKQSVLVHAGIVDYMYLYHMVCVNTTASTSYGCHYLLMWFTYLFIALNDDELFIEFMRDIAR